MSEAAANHRRSADRHDLAAASHERAARFWDGQTDARRASLQREMAEYERQGAELERRWAELVEQDLARSAARAGEVITAQTRKRVENVCDMLTRLAATLDTSADLAEEHARRRMSEGLNPAEEQEAAQRARNSAQRARTQAEEWVKAITAARS